MFFDLGTVLMKRGINMNEMPCTFLGHYQGAKSEEAKRSVCSLIAIQSILLPVTWTRPGNEW